jgi:hypothetical protein
MKSRFQMACLATVALTGLAFVAAKSPAAAAAPVRPSAASMVGWPGFMDNPAHTGYNPDETIIGPGNASSLHQKWLASTAEPADSDTPTIADGSLFADSYGGGTGTLQAWNASTGAPRWSVSIEISDPAYGDGRIFADTFTTMNAYDAATGALDWSVPFDSGVDDEPVYADGLVYVAGMDSVTPSTPPNANSASTSAPARSPRQPW